MWAIDMCEGGDTNSMEFVVPAADPSSFFPIDVTFEANKTFAEIAVARIENLRGGQDAFASSTVLSVDSYQIA